MKREGIAVAGNMIVDVLYPILGNPKPGELTTITDGISRSTGGALCNVIVDLAKLDPAVPLTALGRVGTDPEGDYILEKLNVHVNIDTSRVRREGLTSFTAVMADTIGKQRTFFHYRGANARFCEKDVDWDSLNVAILHIGYLLLLDALDEPDAIYGTKMARLLHTAQKKGIKTSIDVVSEAGDRFCRIVPPALNYTDYCVINELEAQASTGVPLRGGETGELLRENLPKALQKLKALGVSTWAVIHCPEGGFGLDTRGEYVAVESLPLPREQIKGTVGAGDAFCAGVLCGAYRGWSLPEAIELGSAAAACSLSESGATEGMRTVDESMELYREFRP
ncbi:MAG: carbohydrate kinase family protein [Eubacteriales bacterium]|nr:carbohydrate kinase family protein [Eubacteriales bacterium]